MPSAGLSTRAIAPIVGVSQKQVRNDQVSTEYSPASVVDPEPPIWQSATETLAQLQQAASEADPGHVPRVHGPGAVG